MDLKALQTEHAFGGYTWWVDKRTIYYGNNPNRSCNKGILIRLLVHFILLFIHFPCQRRWKGTPKKCNWLVVVLCVVYVNLVLKTGTQWVRIMPGTTNLSPLTFEINGGLNFRGLICLSLNQRYVMCLYS